MSAPRRAMIGALAALGLIGACALAGCGGGGSAQQGGGATTAASAPVGTDAQLIRILAARFEAAVLAGDGKGACADLTEGAINQVLADPKAVAYGSTCASRMSAAGTLLGALTGPGATVKLTKLVVHGDHAEGIIVWHTPNAPGHAKSDPSRFTAAKVKDQWKVVSVHRASIA